MPKKSYNTIEDAAVVTRINQRIAARELRLLDLRLDKSEGRFTTATEGGTMTVGPVMPNTVPMPPGGSGDTYSTPVMSESDLDAAIKEQEDAIVALEEERKLYESSTRKSS